MPEDAPLTEDAPSGRPAAAAASHPAWFAAVMGTAPIALAASRQSRDWGLDWLLVAAVVFLLIATVLAIWLFPRYARRLSHREELRAELCDPTCGPMLATLPAGLLLLAAAWGQAGRELVPLTVALWIDAVLLLIGTAIALVIGVAWADSVRGSARSLSSVNGSWLIPPVMNMIVPLGLAPLILAVPEAASVLLFVGYMFFGIGLFLWLCVMPLLVARLALVPAMPAELAPTMWVPLGPAGILGLVVVNLSTATVAIGAAGRDLQVVAVVVASLGIGFGVWWALFAATDLVRARRAAAMPFHPGWWGFVFPVAALTLSVMTVADATQSLPIRIVGSAMFLVLLVLWGMVAWRSLRLGRQAEATG